VGQVGNLQPIVNRLAGDEGESAVGEMLLWAAEKSCLQTGFLLSRFVYFITWLAFREPRLSLVILPPAAE
jgi:hypothetical protein